MADTTTIAVELRDWQRLQALKSKPGETFADVVRRLLDEREGAESRSEAVRAS